MILWLFVFLLWPISAGAVPNTVGWHDIPNTTLRTVCAADNGFPGIAATEGCPAITSNWNSAWFDTTRNTIILHGGGHFG